MPIEKNLNLKGKAEFSGARKILSALKRAHKIKGPVKLVGAPAVKTAHKRRANGPFGSSQYKDQYLDYNAEREARGLKPVTVGTFLAYTLQGKAKQYSGGYERALHRALGGHPSKPSAGGRMAYSRNPRRLPNIGGFIDHEGRFHPIRSGEREITYGGQRVLVKDEVPYSRKRAHERPKAKRRNPGKRKKKNPPKLSKKQAFLRRMALGRARAKRARARR